MAQSQETRVSREVVIPTPSLIASAVRYPARLHESTMPETRRGSGTVTATTPSVGEARAAARFMGRALSRTTLRVAREGDKGTAFVEDGTTRTPERPFNGKDGQAQMLESIGIHLTIAGGAQSVALQGPKMRMGISTTRAKSGKLCQSSKSRLRGRTGQLTTMEMDPVVNLSGDDIVIRIWQPNPAKRIEADSPFRSLLPILSRSSG